MPFKANNNRGAVVVYARHVVKRSSKRSVLVTTKDMLTNNTSKQIWTFLRHQLTDILYMFWTTLTETEVYSPPSRLNYIIFHFKNC